jgi:oxaloacetate decarboxylase alpha subunit/pyruvate carboxylase subunit B
MPGTVIRYQVNVGDKVKAGDIVVMLEAMKMENAIPAPADGVIKSVSFGPGSSVKKGEVLAIIAK